MGDAETLVGRRTGSTARWYRWRFPVRPSRKVWASLPIRWWTVRQDCCAEVAHRLVVSGYVHESGIMGSKYIVAINKDEAASIFDIADVGIVGDVKEILPLLIEEIKAQK